MNTATETTDFEEGEHSLLVDLFKLGLILVGLVLVVGMIGTLFYWGVFAGAGSRTPAMIAATSTTLTGVESASLMFAVKFGRPPQSLQELVTPPPKGGRQVVPYLQALPIDAWEHPLNYRVAAGAESLPVIWSNGPNGRDDNREGDDIVLWFTPASTPNSPTKSTPASATQNAQASP